MFTTQPQLAVAYLTLLLISGVTSNRAAAEESDSAEGFISGSNVSLQATLRYESATDDALPDASALTLRSALAWNTGPMFGIPGLTGLAELENVAVLGRRDYTDGAQTRGTVIIADPPATEANQLYLAYTSPRGVVTKVGRQELAYGDERFVGPVAFRQNHQSFDAVSVSYERDEQFSLNYAYVNNVNRLFGDNADDRPAGQLGDHKQDTHLINAVFNSWSAGEFEAYAYLIDNKDFRRAATDTYGVRFHGSVRPSKLTYLYTLEAARQHSGSDNPVDYDANYLRLSGGLSYRRISAKLTHERLGSDNGSGFITPLATLHKFQGWADKFVALTPNEGVITNTLTIAGRWPGFRYRLQYHDFDTDVGSDNIGTEFGVHIQRRIKQDYLLELKYAHYHGQNGATGPGGLGSDTRRLFLSISARLGED